jgi:hypothetical protein
MEVVCRDMKRAREDEETRVLLSNKRRCHGAHGLAPREGGKQQAMRVPRSQRPASCLSAR